MPSSDATLWHMQLAFARALWCQHAACRKRTPTHGDRLCNSLLSKHTHTPPTHVWQDLVVLEADDA